MITQPVHRVSATSTVEAPADSLDLSAWTFGLTADEYAHCAPEHHGSLQAALPNGKRMFISVETIDGCLMAHHYVEDIAERSRMRAVSSTSQLWLTPKIAVGMKVTWDLRLEPLSAQTCQLTCEVLVETADVNMIAAVAGRQPGATAVVQAHCEHETRMFAADMQRKAVIGLYGL